MRLSALLALSTLLVGAAATHADTLTFSFGNTGSAYRGSGTLTTGTALTSGTFPVTALTGTVTALGANAVSISSLLSPGTFPTVANGGTYPPNDNVVFYFPGTNGTFSQNGISFLLGNGTQVNLFNGGTGADVFVLPQGGTGFFETAPITIGAATAATPEPTSFLLLGTGLFSVGLFRKFV